jgi:Family of unknown function (DUF5302)
MTKSAKQDAMEGPAETAETESAAIAEADAEADADADAKQETAAESAAADHTDDDKPAIDDVKAKFREALDRKRQVHAEGQGKGAHEAGKVTGAHGPAASRRNFRRKSG